MKPGTHIINEGKHQIKLEIDPASCDTQAFVIRLVAPGSEIEVLGVIKSAKNQKPIVKTTIIHEAPDTKAKTLILTVAKDSAAPRHEGLIRIEPTARGSQSKLTNRTLLIGRTAKVWTRPALEILSGDVQCSHAATVRTLSEEDFYPFAVRGIGADVARKTLISAFLTQKP